MKTSSIQFSLIVSGRYDLIASAVPAAWQPGQAAFLNKVAQVTGCGGFGYLGHGLVLRRADIVLKAKFAAIEQSVKHFDLLCR